MIKHLNIRVFGRVQGVFFRTSAKAEADRLGVVGSVRNCDDGSVCIEAEGEQHALDQFLQWCHDGPDFAHVERVDVEKGAVTGYTEFVIL